MINKNYNPDVLSCLANLSNDEVFTSPVLANQMLDLLPGELWSNKDAKFLDPSCKTGIFLREIAKRLMIGLEKQIPNIQERINHIYNNQLYGIAITNLTALLSRRSLYCSKMANGKYSVCNVFKTENGNIIFNETKHVWVNGYCRYCGASKEVYNRSDLLETHAYEFVHTKQPEGLLKDMRFDVIVGNPPYQLGDAGAFASASPLYHKFVQQAKKLNPRYLVMIIPSRWFAGGKGLDEFRNEMLHDDRIRVLHDYPIAADVFPGTRIAGGVCYFLWNRDNKGLCQVVAHEGEKIVSKMERSLLEQGTGTFVRMNEAIPILRKVLSKKEPSFSTIVSPRKPYGLTSDFFNNPSKYRMPKISDNPIKGGITIYGVLKYKSVRKYVPIDYPITSGKESINKYKVFVSQVLDNGFDLKKERLKPFIGLPYEICTETYLRIGSFEDRKTAENIISYMNTKFFHILMFLKKISHHVVAKVYEYVPLQDFSQNWTDEKLYHKYKLTKEEIDFIEKMVRPINDNNE